MNCTKTTKLISFYIDDMLSDSKKAQFESHINMCPSCRSELEAIKEMMAHVHGIGEVAVPLGLKDEIMQAVKEQTVNEQASVKTGSRLLKKIRMRYVYTGAAAACLIISFTFILLGIFGTKSYNDEPYALEDYVASEAAPQEAPQMASSDGQDYGGGGEYAITNDSAYIMGNQVGMTEAAPQEAPMEEAVVEEPSLAMEEESVARDDSYGSIKEADNVLSDQKIIRTLNYDLQVENFDNATAKIRQIAELSGGYVENFDSHVYSAYDGIGGNRDMKSGFICIKVPSSGYMTVKIKIEALGRIISTSEASDNITSQYIDTEARLLAKQAEEQRLLELIGKAQHIDDLISLESRLSYVRSDIESMVGQIRSWDNLTAFSTINISIDESLMYNKVKSIDPTLSEKIAEGFNRSLNNFLYNTERLIIMVAENSIAILLFIFVVSVAVGILRKVYIKRKGF